MVVIKTVSKKTKTTLAMGRGQLFKAIFGACFVMSCYTACPKDFYSPNNGTCLPCDKKCAGGQVAVAPCSATQNLKCECPNRQFYHPLKHSCFECKTAKEGEFYKKNCTKFENAVLENCKLGTYTLDHFQCLNCSKCPFKFEMKINCSRSHDTICEKEKEDSSGGTTTGIALGITIPLILIAVAVILWVFWRRRRVNRQQADGSEGLGSTSGDGIRYFSNGLGTIPENGGNLAENGNIVGKTHASPTKGAGKKPKYHRTSSQVSQSSLNRGTINPMTDNTEISVIGSGSKDDPDSSLKWKYTSMSELGFNTRMELSYLLLPKQNKDWRYLAGKLGIPNQEINVLAMSKEPVIDMFKKYECFEEQSITSLYKALKEMERYDACRILECFIERE